MFDDIIRVIIVIILFVSVRFGSFNARVYAVRRYAFERFVDVCLFSATLRVSRFGAARRGVTTAGNYEIVIKGARRWTNRCRRLGNENARSVYTGRFLTG
jgi:hypothetical protein